jgi:hypothetical protein
MADFPNIHDFRPTDLGFTCIHPCKRKADEPPRRCSRAVNRNDRTSADNLRSEIMVHDGHGKHIRQLLVNYAELCCCKQTHRKNAFKLGRYYEVATNWQLELFGHRDGGLTVVPSLPLLQRFLPYESKGRRDTLRDAFSSPLGQQESEDGTLYMIKRLEDPGFVKIGYTQKIADVRYKFFESSCGFEPLPLRQIRRVPSVRRVERLVHNELNQYRRECTTCTRRLECGALHTEWFEVEEERAMAVMENWALWMSDAAPYRADGRLQHFWGQHLRNLEEIGLWPTSTNVIEAWHKQQAQERSLVVGFSRLQIGLKSVERRTQPLAAALEAPSQLEPPISSSAPFVLSAVAYNARRAPANRSEEGY